MNKQAGMVVQVLIMLILVVLTSITVLFFVKTGFIEVKGQVNEQILYLEFLPFQREGTLNIRNFQFCDYIEESQCYGSNQFYLPADVHFLFIVESTVYNGEIKLIENYQIKDHLGRIILEVDDGDNFHFDLSSDRVTEEIVFTDFFTVNEELKPGTYTLDLIVENSILDKKITLSREFEIMEEPLISDDDGVVYEEEYYEEEYYEDEFYEE